MYYYAVKVQKRFFPAPATGDLPGRRLHRDPVPYLEALQRAERAAHRSCAKASGGRKGQWRVVRHGDTFIKEKQP